MPLPLFDTPSRRDIRILCVLCFLSVLVTFQPCVLVMFQLEPVGQLRRQRIYRRRPRGLPRVALERHLEDDVALERIAATDLEARDWGVPAVAPRRAVDSAERQM